MRKQLLSVLLSLSLFLVVVPTSSAYNDVFVFGDSLSDAGAFGFLAGGAACPPAPYDGCRFSNGPTWAELLANSLGTTASTAYAPGGGTNYAIGGERSDELLASASAVNGGQIPDFIADVGGVADPGSLYIVWAGGNDFLQNNPPVTEYLPAVAAQNVVDSVLALSALGATDFLVPNLPIADPWAFTFNAELSSLLGGLVGLNIFELDVLSIFGTVLLDPAAFGFTNVTDPCFIDPATVCPNPDEYALWDAVHPTAALHEILAGQALATIPEPSTALLVGLGLTLLAARRRQ